MVKVIRKVIEIFSHTVKLIIKRMKTRRAAGPGDIPIQVIKRRGQKLLEMIAVFVNKIINGKYRKSGSLLL